MANVGRIDLYENKTRYAKKPDMLLRADPRIRAALRWLTRHAETPRVVTYTQASRFTVESLIGLVVAGCLVSLSMLVGGRQR